MMTEAKRKALALHEPKGQLPRFPSAEELELYKVANFARSSLSDDDWVSKVAAFRRLYRLSDHDQKDIGSLPAARSMLHRRMLAEEFGEAMGLDADGLMDLHDLIGVTPRPIFTEEVDGLLDVIYVAIGTLLEMGFSTHQVRMLMEEVHASNMTKTDDAGRPIFDEGGKVLKGANYVKADIAGLIRQMRVGLAHRPFDAEDDNGHAD